MSDVIDLTAERQRREAPDTRFVTKDRWGRPMFAFACSFDHAGSELTVRIWAYDHADAEARVASLRDTLRVDGQLYAASEQT